MVREVDEAPPDYARAMTARADDPLPPEAGRLPTGRLARTARVGGLVTGQGLRWAGMTAANRVRSPERAEVARDERTAALVGELVDQLSRMRGAAMKVGQLFSMIELDGLPEEQRAELETKLATLRDDVPPVPFSRLEKLMREELGAPLGRVFASFDERAFAAASIGQVHRATTRDGDEVVVKVQYPGVAEAVDSDLRSATLLLPLIKRLAPGLDAPPAVRRAARADRRGARLRAGGAAPAARRAPVPRPPVHHRAARPDRALHPSRAGLRVRRGRALRGGACTRRGAARPLRRDRLPLLLRPALPAPDRARRSAPRQLPPVPRRPGRLPRLRPRARPRRRAHRRRAGDRPRGARRGPRRAEGGARRRRLRAGRARRRSGRGSGAGDDGRGAALVRRAGGAPTLAGAPPATGARGRSPATRSAGPSSATRPAASRCRRRRSSSAACTCSWPWC